MSDIVSLITLAFKIAMIIYDKLKASPVEDRSKLLAEYDDAVRIAKEKKDLTKLSKLLGDKL